MICDNDSNDQHNTEKEPEKNDSKIVLIHRLA